MTITQRNSMALIIIAILITILTLLTFLPFILHYSASMKPKLGHFLTPNFIFALLLILYSIVSLISVRMFFFKTNSHEIFFFMLFLATMIFESSRPLIALLRYFNYPDSYIMFLSRTAYFGKICGTNSLFVSALFSSDIETRKLDTPVIVILVLSFLLSSSMPLSDTVLQNSYYKPGFFNYFIFSLIFIDLLTFLIFLINFFQKKNSEYLFLSLSVLLISSGREFSFYFSSVGYFSVGIIFMIAGTILFANKLHGIYKWY